MYFSWSLNLFQNISGVAHKSSRPRPRIPQELSAFSTKVPWTWVYSKNSSESGPKVLWIGLRSPLGISQTFCKGCKLVLTVWVSNPSRLIQSLLACAFFFEIWLKRLPDTTESCPKFCQKLCHVWLKSILDSALNDGFSLTILENFTSLCNAFWNYKNLASISLELHFQPTHSKCLQSRKTFLHI